MREDFSNDSGRWMPEEGLYNVEIAKMEAGFSQAGHPKYTLKVVSADDYSKGMDIDLTNIPGKRWLLRQLIEACGIVPEETEEGKRTYDWDNENFTDIIGKVVTAKIIHDKKPFTGRDGKEITIPKAKIVEFQKLQAK